MSRIPRSFVTPSSKLPVGLESSTPLENVKKFLPIKPPPLHDITADKNLLDVTSAKKMPAKKPFTNNIVKKPDLKRPAVPLNHTLPSKQSKVESKAPMRTTAKIAPYDFKAKFNDLTERHKVLRTENSDLEDKFGKCADELVELRTSYESLYDQHTQVTKDYEELCTQHGSIQNQFDDLTKLHDSEKTLCEEFKTKSNTFEEQLLKLKEDYKITTQKLTETEVKLSAKVTEYEVVKSSFEKEVKKCSQMSAMCEENQLKMLSQTSEITFLTTRQKILDQRNEENMIRIASLTEEKENLLLEVKKLTEQVTNLMKELQEKVTELDKLNSVYNDELKKNSQLDTVIRGNCQEISTFQTELTSLGRSKEYLEIKNVRDCKEKEDLFIENIKLKEIIQNMHNNQKALRNEIQDLKGHIRVYCRIRPPLQTESGKQLLNTEMVDACTMEFDRNIVNSVAGGLKKQKHSFSFDGIFPVNSTQSDVFAEVSCLIQSALDGYNVCIFAYGQTGSGKTYTMEGGSDDIYKGIIPRAIEMIFSSLPSLQDMGWEFKITASFLEIYNENIYDLLDASKDQEEHSIKMVDGKSNEVYVTNLKEEPVNDAATLMRLLYISQKNRQTAATVCNERSSRSHAVSKIKISAFNEKRQEKYVSNLNLVDLAGSESAKTSQRMDETKSINKSLSELSKVILALQAKQSHIPYRNSKLTYLLMPSLGGNSKTMMLVNVPQFDDCYQETVNSLRFAAKVNSCRSGVTKKNLSTLT